MDQSTIQMTRMLVLLAPDNMNNEVYEIMSMISASIIEEDEQLALFTTGSQEDLFRLIERKCDRFIRKKMKSFLEG